jgi:hypothetical protein
VALTEAGIDTSEESFEVDAIVFATGFDAMTGPLITVVIAARNRRSQIDSAVER